MLHKIEYTNPNAVQKYFCEPFEKLVPTEALQREQDKVTAELFMTAGSLPPEMDISPEHAERMLALAEIEVYSGMENLFKIWGFTYTIDFRSKFFISLLCEELHKSGYFVLFYLTYIQYIAQKNNKKHIDFMYICEKVFPYGVPLVKDFEDLCKASSVYTGHCEEPDGKSILSFPDAMASIMDIAPEKVIPPTEEKKEDDWNIMNVMKRFK